MSMQRKKVGYANFRQFTPKTGFRSNLPRAIGKQNYVSLIISTHMSTSYDNLMKIGQYFLK